MAVNVDAMCPWELALTLAGQQYSTRKPTWGDVVELAKLEDALKAGLACADPQFEESLRSGLKRFFPEAVAPVIHRAAYDELIAAFCACSGYFSEWLAKKRLTATGAGRQAAGAKDVQPQPAAASRASSASRSG